MTAAPILASEGKARAALAWRLVVTVVIVAGVSVLTVLRDTVDYLQADGVQQSVMSIQDVDLFFWGQNRFAAFVSFLASPIANPDANLFACLLINALAFHALLLVLAHMGVRVVAGRRDVSWWDTLVLFLVLTAVAHWMIQPSALHVMALESQPYSMSLTFTLLAFVLWKRDGWVARSGAALLVGLSMGLNQSTIVIAAFLAVVEMVRRKQWYRWPSFGGVWLGWFGVWAWLSARYGGNAGPIPDAQERYFAFDPHQARIGAAQSVSSVLATLSAPRATLALVVAVVAAVLVVERRRLDLRFTWAVLFGGAYWVLFTGNPWVAANGYVFRYFYPVVILGVLFVGTPIAAVLLRAVHGAGLVPGLRARLAGEALAAARRGAVVAVAAVACLVAFVGPMASPASATVLVQSRGTADWVRAHGITFVSGYYWDMWPILERSLEDGRQAVHVTAFKSGGDPANYRKAFDAARARPGGARAVCVNDDMAICQTYLDYWTEPGWRPTGETCPVPGAVPQLGSPAVRQCLVLKYVGT